MHEKIEFLQFQLQLSINLQSWFFLFFFLWPIISPISHTFTLYFFWT